MSWLRRTLRSWLGIESLDVSQKRLSQGLSRQNELLKNLVSIGVDVHFKSPHMILIYSAINGGQISHIEANFKDAYDLRDFIESLKVKFHTERVRYDAPPELYPFLNRKG